ncbi:hypothetical protein [Sinisalibacter aestuarii]|nr:hypothetical protein [Sinisalibacter aestuarii]
MSTANKAFLVMTLVANLIAALVFAGYAETAHALTAAGSRTIVICGTAGEAETITLDRNGDRVENPVADCVHCADCTLVSVFIDPSNPEPCLRQAGLRAGSVVTGEAPELTRPVEHPSRGPPSQKVV